MANVRHFSKIIVKDNEYTIILNDEDNCIIVSYENFNNEESNFHFVIHPNTKRRMDELISALTAARDEFYKTPASLINKKA